MPNPRYIYDQFGNVVGEDPAYAGVDPAQAEQDDLLALIQAEEQRQAEQREAQAAAGNMRNMVNAFTQPQPQAQAPLQQPQEPAIPTVIPPDGPMADGAFPDTPLAPEEAAVLSENRLLTPSDQVPIEPQPLAEDGPKAEMVAEDEILANQQRVEQQQQAQKLADKLAYFSARGADPQTAQFLADTMSQIESEVLAPLDTAAVLRGQASMVRAGAEGQAATDTLAATQEYDTETRAALTGLVDRTQDRLSKIAAYDAKIQQGEINPDRVWENKGNMEKAFIGLGAGLYRMLQVKQGTLGGANPVIATLERTIARDLAAQEKNINLLFDKRKLARQDVLDDQQRFALKEAAMGKLKANKLSSAIAVMNQTIASGALPREAQAKMLEDRSKVRGMYFETLQGIGDNIKASAGIQGGKIKGAAQDQDFGKYSVNMSKTGLSIDGNSVFHFKTENDKKIAQEVARTAPMILQKLAELQNMALDRGVSWSEKSSLANQKAKAIASSMIKAFPRMSDMDLPFVLGQFGLDGEKLRKLFRLKSEDTIKATFRQVAQDVEDEMIDTMQLLQSGKVGYAPPSVDRKTGAKVPEIDREELISKLQKGAAGDLDPAGLTDLFGAIAQLGTGASHFSQNTVLAKQLPGMVDQALLHAEINSREVGEMTELRKLAARAKAVLKSKKLDKGSKPRGNLAEEAAESLDAFQNPELYFPE